MPRERADGIYDLLVRFRFQQVSSCSSVEDFADQLVTVVHREHQHFGGWCASADLSGRLDPVEDRERNIEHGDVGLVLEGEIDSIAPIARLSAHDEVGAGLE